MDDDARRKEERGEKSLLQRYLNGEKMTMNLPCLRSTRDYCPDDEEDEENEENKEKNGDRDVQG